MNIISKTLDTRGFIHNVDWHNLKYFEKKKLQFTVKLLLCDFYGLLETTEILM